jgi:hypothetical protein
MEKGWLKSKTSRPFLLEAASLLRGLEYYGTSVSYHRQLRNLKNENFIDKSIINYIIFIV